MHGRVLMIRALTPIHTGTGQAVGTVDLPIARERTTGWPQIPASTLKGVARDAMDPRASADASRGHQRQEDGSDRVRLFLEAFGPDPEHAADHAGALVFTDAHLLFLPVRSLMGTFALVTCPAVLSRFRRDTAILGIATIPEWQADVSGGRGAVCRGSVVAQNDRAFLEDLDIAIVENYEDAVAGIASALRPFLIDGEAGEEALRRRLLVVDDEVFSFLCETATEVVARVRLDDQQKTVQRGGLWYEEALPAEAVLWSLVLVYPRPEASWTPQDMLRYLRSELDPLLQVGGHSSVGRGIARVFVAGGEAA